MSSLNNLPTIENLPVPRNVRFRRTLMTRSDVETELFYDQACETLIDCLDESHCVMAPVVHDCVFPVRNSSSQFRNQQQKFSQQQKQNRRRPGCNPDSARLWFATLLFLHRHRFRLVWWIRSDSTLAMEAGILDLVDALDPSGCSSVVAKSGPLAVPVLAAFAEFHEKAPNSRSIVFVLDCATEQTVVHFLAKHAPRWNCHVIVVHDEPLPKTTRVSELSIISNFDYMHNHHHHGQRNSEHLNSNRSATEKHQEFILPRPHLFSSPERRRSPRRGKNSWKKRRSGDNDNDDDDEDSLKSSSDSSASSSSSSASLTNFSSLTSSRRNGGHGTVCRSSASSSLSSTSPSSSSSSSSQEIINNNDGDTEQGLFDREEATYENIDDIFLLESTREANRFADWVANCNSSSGLSRKFSNADDDGSEGQHATATAASNESFGRLKDSLPESPHRKKSQSEISASPSPQQQQQQQQEAKFVSTMKQQREQAERALADQRALETLQRLCGRSAVLQNALLRIREKLREGISIKDFLAAFLDRNPTATDKVFGELHGKSDRKNGGDNKSGTCTRRRNATPSTGGNYLGDDTNNNSSVRNGVWDNHRQASTKVQKQLLQVHHESLSSKKSKATFLHVVPGFAMTRFGRRKTLTSFPSRSQNNAAFIHNNNNNNEAGSWSSTSAGRRRSTREFRQEQENSDGDSDDDVLTPHIFAGRAQKSQERNDMLPPPKKKQTTKQSNNKPPQQRRRPTLTLRQGSVTDLMKRKGSIFSDGTLFASTFSISTDDRKGRQENGEEIGDAQNGQKGYHQCGGAKRRRATHLQFDDDDALEQELEKMKQGSVDFLLDATLSDDDDDDDEEERVRDDEEVEDNEHHEENEEGPESLSNKNDNRPSPKNRQLQKKQQRDKRHRLRQQQQKALLFQKVRDRVKAQHSSSAAFDEDSAAAVCSIACDQTMCNLPDNCALSLFMCVTLPPLFPACLFPPDVVDAWLDVGIWIQVGEMIWVPEEVVAGLNVLVGCADLTKLEDNLSNAASVPISSQDVRHQKNNNYYDDELLLGENERNVHVGKEFSEQQTTRDRMPDKTHQRSASASVVVDPQTEAMNQLILLAQPTALEAVFVASSQWLLSIQRANGGTVEKNISYWSRYQTILASKIQREARIRLIDSSILTQLFFCAAPSSTSSSSTNIRDRQSSSASPNQHQQPFSIVRQSAMLLPENSSEWGVADVRKMRETAEQLLQSTKRMEDVIRVQENVLGVFLKLIVGDSQQGSASPRSRSPPSPLTHAVSFASTSNFSGGSVANFPLSSSSASLQQQHHAHHHQQQQQSHPQNRAVVLGTTIADLVQSTSALCLFKQLATLNLAHGNGYAAEQYCKKFSSLASALRNGRDDNPAKGCITMFLGQFDYLYSQLESRRALALSNSDMLAKDVYSGVRHTAIAQAEAASRKLMESAYEKMHEAIVREKFGKVLSGLVAEEVSLYHRAAAACAEIGLREGEAVQHATKALQAAREAVRIPPTHTEGSGVSSAVAAASRASRCFDDTPLFLLAIAEGNFDVATQMLEREPFLAYCGLCTENRFDSGKQIEPGRDPRTSKSRDIVCGGKLCDQIISAMHFPRPDYLPHLNLYVSNLLPIDLARHHGMDWSGRRRSGAVGAGAGVGRADVGVGGRQRSQFQKSPFCDRNGNRKRQNRPEGAEPGEDREDGDDSDDEDLDDYLKFVSSKTHRVTGSPVNDDDDLEFDTSEAHRTTGRRHIARDRKTANISTTTTTSYEVDLNTLSKNTSIAVALLKALVGGRQGEMLELQQNEKTNSLKKQTEKTNPARSSSSTVGSPTPPPGIFEVPDEDQDEREKQQQQPQSTFAPLQILNLSSSGKESKRRIPFRERHLHRNNNNNSSNYNDVHLNDNLHLNASSSVPPPNFSTTTHPGLAVYHHGHDQDDGDDDHFDESDRIHAEAFVTTAATTTTIGSSSSATRTSITREMLELNNSLMNLNSSANATSRTPSPASTSLHARRREATANNPVQARRQNKILENKSSPRQNQPTPAVSQRTTNASFGGAAAHNNNNSNNCNDSNGNRPYQHIPMYLLPLNLLLQTVNPFDADGVKFLEAVLATGVDPSCCSPHDMRIGLHIAFDRRIHLFAERLLRVPGVDVELNAEFVLESTRQGLSTRALVRQIPNPRFAPLFYVRQHRELVESVLATHPDAQNLFRKYLKFFLFKADLELLRNFGRSNRSGTKRRSDSLLFLSNGGGADVDDEIQSFATPCDPFLTKADDFGKLLRISSGFTSSNNNTNQAAGSSSSSSGAAAAASRGGGGCERREMSSPLSSAKNLVHQLGSNQPSQLQRGQSMSLPTLITNFGKRLRQRKLDEGKNSSYAASVRTLRLLARQQQLTASEKLLMRIFFDPEAGLPPIRRLLVEVLLVDEPNVEVAYSLFSTHESEYLQREQKLPPSAAPAAVQALRQRRATFLAQQVTIAKHLSGQFLYHRTIDPVSLARLAREMLPTSFLQTVGLLSRTSNMLLTRVFLEHLLSVCETASGENLMPTIVAAMTIPSTTSQHKPSQEAPSPWIDLGYESQRRTKHSLRARLEKNYNNNSDRNNNGNGNVGAETSIIRIVENPAEIGAQELESNPLPVLQMHNPHHNHHLHRTVSLRFTGNKNDSSAMNQQQQQSRRSAMNLANSTKKRLLSSTEISLLEKLFRSYRLTKRVGCAVLLLHIFPEMEDVLPPNDYDPFREESDIWRTENYYREIGKGRGATSITKKKDVDLRNSVNTKGEGDPLTATSSSSSSSTATTTASASTQQPYVANETTVITKLLNDARWLGNFGSPFVENEKRFDQNLDVEK